MHEGRNRTTGRGHIAQYGDDEGESLTEMALHGMSCRWRWETEHNRRRDRGEPRIPLASCDATGSGVCGNHLPLRIQYLDGT